MANTNNYVYQTSKEALAKMCEAGHFPEINYKRNERGFTSFYLMEWSTVFAQFRTVIHEALVERGYEKGIFATRLRSAKFQADVDEIIAGITPEMITAHPRRFKTMFE